MSDPKLRETLKWWQIFFIVFSAVVGGGIFFNDGEALEVAGPGGMLLAVGVIGIIACFVMEGISELVQLFPVPNAPVEYVAAFVDQDFGWVIGIAHWYVYASIFAAQNLAAADHATYWGLSQVWQTIIFYILAPLSFTVINLFPVFVFGVIETIGGALKILLVLGGAILMYVGSSRDHEGSDGPITDGFRNYAHIVTDHNRAVCYVIPIIAYSFLGLEIVTITAHEAKSPGALRISSQHVSWVVFLLYFLSALGDVLNVKWTDANLPPIYGGISNNSTAPTIDKTLRSSSMMIIATKHAGLKIIPGFLNGCFIFSVLSASNTSLYVASRILFGLARETKQTTPLGKLFHGLCKVELRSEVPVRAILVSAISFLWLPFLNLRKGYAISAIIEIIAASASVSCLIVWAALTLAYIRYELWLRMCHEDVKADWPTFVRNVPGYKPWTLLMTGQPAVAYLGLIGCFLVFGFASATWWDNPATISKVAVAYGSPIVLFAIWLSFKAARFLGLIRGKSMVKLGNAAELSERFQHLDWIKQGQRPIIRRQDFPVADQAASAPVQLEHGNGSDVPLRERANGSESEEARQ